MKHLYKVLLVGATLSSAQICAQTQLDNILSSVESNNRSLKAFEQMMTSDSATLFTGLTPENPSISADYMIGRPVSGGNQFDFLAVQSLEFPSVYSRRKQLAGEKADQLRIEYNILRQQTLLDTKLLYLNALNLNRRKATVFGRLTRAQQVEKQYQSLFANEQITAIEFNRAKIRTLELNASYRSLETQIELINSQLTGLNGGTDIAVEDSLFNTELLPALQGVYDTILSQDIKLQWYIQQRAVDQVNLSVVKSLSLPKLEGGYHYQSVLGQTFNGVHIGISVPLWEHKNKVSAAALKEQVTVEEMEAYKVVLWSTTKSLHQQLENLANLIEGYEAALNEFDSQEILDKSLEMGEIDFITYANELQYLYGIEDELMNKQLEYQLGLAQLLKYQQ